MLAMIGGKVIHPGSFFIKQLHKAQGALVRWDIRSKYRSLVSAALDTVRSGYRQLRDFWREEAE